MNAVHCNWVGIGLFIHSDLRIFLGPWDVPRASPLGHLSDLWKSLGRRRSTLYCTTQYIAPLSSVQKPYYRNMITLQFSSLLAVHHWSGPALTFSLVGYSPPLLLPTPPPPTPYTRHHFLGTCSIWICKTLSFMFHLKPSTESLHIEILKAEDVYPFKLETGTFS